MTPSNYVSVNELIRALLIQSFFSSTPIWGMALSIKKNEPPEESLGPRHNSINHKCRNAVGGIICLIINERKGLGSHTPIFSSFSSERCPLKQRGVKNMSLRNIIPSTFLQKLTHVMALAKRNTLNHLNTCLKLCLTWFNLALPSHFDHRLCCLQHLLNNSGKHCWESLFPWRGHADTGKLWAQTCR